MKVVFWSGERDVQDSAYNEIIECIGHENDSIYVLSSACRKNNTKYKGVREYWVGPHAYKKANLVNRAIWWVRRKMWIPGILRVISPDVIVCTSVDDMKDIGEINSNGLRIIMYRYVDPLICSEIDNIEWLEYCNYCDGIIFATEEIKNRFPNRVTKQAMTMQGQDVVEKGILFRDYINTIMSKKKEIKIDNEESVINSILRDVRNEIFKEYNEFGQSERMNELVERAIENERIDCSRKLSFCYDVSFACNLNCAGCDRFSCLRKDPDLPNYQSVISSLHRMDELFGNQIEVISITGGESLLNPELISYIEETRKIFMSVPHIRLLTNGILLGKMDERFWEAIKNNDIEIHVSRYPGLKIYERLHRLALEKGVLIFISDLGSEGKDFEKFVFDLDGKQDAKLSFACCDLAGNISVTLYEKRLYPCCIGASSQWFNEAFMKELPCLEDNSINIFSHKREEILNFISNPIPLCKYCDVMHRQQCVEWHTTKKEIGEWT